MTEWYIKDRDEELGPFSATDMRSKANSGELAADALVRRSTDKSWISASRIHGMFATEKLETNSPTSKMPKQDAKPTEYANPSNSSLIWVIGCLAILSLLTVINTVLIFKKGNESVKLDVAKQISPKLNDELDYRSLVARIEANEKLLEEFKKLHDNPRVEIKPTDSLDLLKDIIQPPITDPVEKPKTPRQDFFAATTKRRWTAAYYTELTVGGDSVRSKFLSVHVDKIIKVDDHLELFVTVKNIGTGHVFSPAAHPYNEQMIFPENCDFIDSFMNRTSPKLERGTKDLKPGESAIIQ